MGGREGPGPGFGEGTTSLSVFSFPRGAAPLPVRSLAWAWGARLRGCYLPPPSRRGNECGETGGKLGPGLG